MRVLVIGDEMVDEWVLGEMGRVSAEAPIGVVKAQEVRRFPGGAGNVKANLVALGVDAKIVKLAPQGPLPVKCRVMVGGTQIARVDFNDECQTISPEALKQVTENQEFDALVVSDYGKGAIGPETVEAIGKMALPTFVDTHGDPSPWWGVASVLFPNAAEFDRWEEEYKRFPNVVVKCGADGMVRMSFGHGVQYEPGREVQAVCSCGAGDSAMAGWVAAWVDGASIEQATRFANACGAAAVREPLTTAVTREMIAAL